MKPSEVVKNWIARIPYGHKMGTVVEIGIPEWLLKKYPCDGLVQSVCIIFDKGATKIYIEYIPKAKKQ